MRALKRSTRQPAARTQMLTATRPLQTTLRTRPRPATQCASMPGRRRRAGKLVMWSAVPCSASSGSASSPCRACTSRKPLSSSLAVLARTLPTKLSGSAAKSATCAAQVRGLPFTRFNQILYPAASCRLRHALHTLCSIPVLRLIARAAAPHAGEPPGQYDCKTARAAHSRRAQSATHRALARPHDTNASPAIWQPCTRRWHVPRHAGATASGQLQVRAWQRRRRGPHTIKPASWQSAGCKPCARPK